MIEKNLANISFQTFFVSREMSNCPQISEIIRFCKKLDGLKILKDAEGTISISYGKRILVNGRDVDLSNIQQEAIVEIVDYDPVKNIVLAMGKKEPCIDTSVHWLIQKARHDIHAVFLLNSKKIFKKLSKDLPVTENEAPSGTIEMAKEVLKTLREGKNILIKNKGALFVGFNLKEIEDSVLKICREVSDES